MTQPNRPDRSLVSEISREEAAAVGLSIAQFLHSSSIVATQARRRAFRRIKGLTGCSAYGLATVFGCDHGAVFDALREPEAQRRKPAPSGFREPAESPLPLSAALACLTEIERIQHGGFSR